MPDSKSLTPALQDKALWLTAFTMLAPLLAVLFHIQVDPQKLAALVTAYVVPAVVFVVTHKAKSAAIVLAEVRAAAEKAVLVEAPIVQGLQPLSPYVNQAGLAQQQAALNALGQPGGVR